MQWCVHWSQVKGYKCLHLSLFFLCPNCFYDFNNWAFGQANKMFPGKPDDKCYESIAKSEKLAMRRYASPVMLLYVTCNLLISYSVNSRQLKDAKKYLILFSVFHFHFTVKTHIFLWSCCWQPHVEMPWSMSFQNASE